MSEALARLLKPQIVRRCRCRELQVVRRSHQPGFCNITSLITFFSTTDVAGPVKCGASGETFHYTCAYFWGLAHQRQRFVRWSQGPQAPAPEPLTAMNKCLAQINKS